MPTVRSIRLFPPRAATRRSPSSTPAICISHDPSPGSCEDCTNGIDDDGNGLVDCADPNCADLPVCGSGQTTTTSVTVNSSSSSTTIESTTTTTNGGVTTTTQPT